MDENFAMFMHDRAEVFKFLSTVFRDEIGEDLLSKMKEEGFLSLLQKMGGKCFSPEMRPGDERLVSCIRAADIDRLHNELRYEYADLFLNAGSVPVFMYESVYESVNPVVNQKPIFEVREFYRKAGVHKSSDYPD
ncbi:MAG TPA: molecular chaperone TorD family protein, partial [Clostridia bacterium]|nr:molecular chaperone TorD family protein [Clostridia bacterium]